MLKTSCHQPKMERKERTKRLGLISEAMLRNTSEVKRQVQVGIYVKIKALLTWVKAISVYLEYKPLLFIWNISHCCLYRTDAVDRRTVNKGWIDTLKILLSHSNNHPSIKTGFRINGTCNARALSLTSLRGFSRNRNVCSHITALALLSIILHYESPSLLTDAVRSLSRFVVGTLNFSDLMYLPSTAVNSLMESEVD